VAYNLVKIVQLRVQNLKRLFPILLILLSVFYATPREACLCFEKSSITSSTSSSEHSCCKSQESMQCVDMGASVKNVSNCCGMTGRSSPLVANSIDLMGGNSKELQVEIICPDRFGTIAHQLCSEPIAYVNRAPPFLKGMGTSDTYLFKRTLLI